MLQESIGGDILIHFFYEAHFTSALNILTTAHSKSHMIPVQDKQGHMAQREQGHMAHTHCRAWGGLSCGAHLSRPRAAVGIKDNMRGLMRGEEAGGRGSLEGCFRQLC